MPEAESARQDMSDGIEMAVRGINDCPQLSYAWSCDTPLHNVIGSIIERSNVHDGYGEVLPISIVAYEKDGKRYARVDDGSDKHPLTCFLDEISEVIQSFDKET